MIESDVVIVGAGIVGLATAWQLHLADPNLSVTVLEKEKEIASHQTGRNSGVIHSGIYYQPGSLKAENCKAGYQLLLDYCDENKIEYDLCGKIIVATDDSELPALDKIFERGKANGLNGLEKLDATKLKEKEPNVSGVAGIWVPQAGIINYKAVAESLAQNIKKKGLQLRLDEKVLKINPEGKSTKIQTTKQIYRSKLLINCAGLYADKLLKQRNKTVQIIPFRGEYYELKSSAEHLVKNLIYPVPNPEFPFLGVHFTRMITGGIEAGPNAVLAMRREGYKKTSFHLGEFWEIITFPGFREIVRSYWRDGLKELYRSWSKKAFTKSLQKLVPAIRSSDLIAGNSGVRAQACYKNGKLVDDFLILEEQGIINVINAPSPAATSSLSIGKTIAVLAMKRLNDN